jgi:hypothetical protein
MFKKNSVRIFVKKIYKMRCLEGSGVPVLYIGHNCHQTCVPVVPPDDGQVMSATCPDIEN